ncbi:hypothetical protein B9Z19DRAFT_1064135 [Tuber borchii]|uniref:Uncharacterized protein n=1 Tax=Tuber borchii TaxID=42251 RepID=A0A2T6ZVT3_TUBBO|nr:hypothetical protein B9Z19DRAFT_1064135 [Tuber borchii]
MAPTKKQPLQDECKALKIPYAGETATQPTELLNKHQKSKEILTIDEDDITCEAILIADTMVGEEDKMKEVAKEAFLEELDKDELEVEHIRDYVFVGNRRGLRLAEMKAMLDAHESKITFLQGHVKELEDNDKALTARVSTLSLAVYEYKQIRRRFISSFKVTKLPEAVEQSDHDLVREGNLVAHGGDAVVDALLYEGIGGRRDIYAFQQLYGLHPADVVKISHHETLNLLNLHAGIRADTRKTGSEEFYQRFAAFILAFQVSSQDTDYLLGNSVNTTRTAYEAVLDCQKYKE